ncbi:MAG: PadR family transcriptional regulator [Candidatus Saccharimonadales bacterium]
MNNSDEFSQLRKGLLEVAVLSAISANEVYAADIIASLALTEFATSEGTLYPLLSRMKRENLLGYSWAESASGPPRKYYRLTKTGQQHLRALRQYLRSITKTLDKLGEKS